MKSVLLVEDDATIRRFFRLALEDLPLTVVDAPTLADGQTALAQDGFDLVVTDLMLPDGQGLDLVDRLRAAGVQVPVLLFSAGVSGPVRERAAALRVDGILEKPVSIVALVDEVQRLVLGAPEPPAVPSRGHPARPEDERQAIDTHFAGQEALFRAFKASSLGQLKQDRLEGDRAVAQANRTALRLLAHSLKTVLGLLGHPAASDAARALEALAARADAPWDGLASAWVALREQLPEA